MFDGFVNVDQMEQTHQRKGQERIEQKSRVFLSPLVAGKCARLFVLELGNPCTG